MLRSDFRLIAATNRDLTKMVQLHRFRKDLLFRLRAFTIELPPLRDRLEDIRTIAAHHVTKLCESYGLAKKSFSPDFFDFLARYAWPGNVRELVNSLERAVAAARQEPILFPKHLPMYLRVYLARAAVEQEQPLVEKVFSRTTSPKEGPLPRLVDLREATLNDLEQTYLRQLMTRATTMQEACSISGLSRSRLYALLKKYNIPSCFRLPSTQ